MLKQLVFHTPDFIESTSWATQLLEKGEGEVFLEVSDDKCTFSFRDRAATLESSTSEATVIFDEDSEDDEDAAIFKIEAAPLARFLKAIPRRAEKVVLDVEVSGSGKVRALAAQAGSLKFKLPTFSESKAPAVLKYTTVATLPAKELFEVMAKAGNATTKEKGSTSEYAMLDFHVSKEDEVSTLKIFGTDSFVMNVAELEIPNEVEEETRILIPAVYSALPEFAAATKSDETIEIIKTKDKKSALGFLFPNGYVAVFNPTSAKPIVSAPKIFAKTEESSTHYFDVDTKVFKSEISRVTTLSPEAERVHLSLSSTKAVFSDGADAVADMDIELHAKEEVEDEESPTCSITFSKFVMTKMFNVIPSRARIFFSPESSAAIYVTAVPEEDEENKGVEQESPLLSEKTIVALFRER